MIKQGEKRIPFHFGHFRADFPPDSHDESAVWVDRDRTRRFRRRRHRKSHPRAEVSGEGEAEAQVTLVPRLSDRATMRRREEGGGARARKQARSTRIFARR